MMWFFQVCPNGREEEMLSNSRDFTEQVPTKRFLSLFLINITPAAIICQLFLYSTQVEKKHHKNDPCKSFRDGFTRWHQPALAQLPVVNMLWTTTQRWPRGHARPRLLVWRDPGLPVTRLLHRFGEATKWDLSRINYSSSEISTEEKLNLRADTDCCSLWIPMPQYLPSECRVTVSFLFYCNCLEIEEDDRKLNLYPSPQLRK